MIVSFKDKATQHIADADNTKAARKALPVELHKIARRKIDILDFAPSLGAVAKVPANRLEKLQGDKRGQHSIRINSQYRICFRWTDAGPTEVEVVDYHDG